MATVLSKIKIIEYKLVTLLCVIDDLKLKNLQLTADKAELKNSIGAINIKLQTKETELYQVNEKIKVLKLARSIQGNEDNESQKDVKLKINELIREVDKCIALMNK